MVGEGVKAGEGDGRGRKVVPVGGHKLTPHFPLQTIKTSLVGRASGLMMAWLRHTQNW